MPILKALVKVKGIKTITPAVIRKTKGKVEKVISSISYTQDLSTDPPRPPGMKDLPKGIQGKVQLGEYVEDKDKPHNIKADNRYKHQYTDKGKQKLL